MKKGTELLKSRINKLQVDFTNIEKQFSINIPQTFKTFAYLFELGEDKYNQSKKLIDNEILVPIHSIIYPFNEEGYFDFIELGFFYDLPDMILEWQECLEDEVWVDDELKPLPIAILYTPPERLYLSIGEKNHGEIWCDKSDSLNPFEKVCLANNIFDFILLLEEKIINGDYYKGKRLFKNWGEDFWRVEDI